MDNKQFFTDVLKAMNLTPSEGALSFLLTWANFEKRAAGRPHGFNPLNTTKDMKKYDPQQTNFNTNAGYPVKSYSNYNTGVKATADTLKLGYYKPIVAILKEGAPVQIAYQKTGISRPLRTWGTHSFANKFIDAASSKKPTVKEVQKQATDTKNKLLTIVVLLVFIGVIAYTYKEIYS
jgi:hypothetical protein